MEEDPSPAAAAARTTRGSSSSELTAKVALPGIASSSPSVPLPLLLVAKSSSDLNGSSSNKVFGACHYGAVVAAAESRANKK